jgi:predicted amidohydrolase YtcJ
MRLLFNANIRTQNPSQPFASAAAIDHGRILMTGSDAEVLSQFETVKDRQDMRGKVIWPGLTDAHLHFQYYAFSLKNIDCETSTQAECLRRVAEKACVLPAGSWIFGYGWNQNSWPEGYGTNKELDTVALHHPVFLTAKSGHAGWANSLALRLAGISQSTPDPEGGRLGRDEAGNPNGLLFETAMNLVHEKLPTNTLNEITDAISESQKTLWQVGLTGLHDFDRSECFAALQVLNQNDMLRLRVLKSIPLDVLDHAAALGLRSGFGNDYLRMGSVKIFVDGALGPGTAAMLQPYESDSSNTGILLMDNEEIFEHGQQAVSNGFSIAIHAIGDRANHEVLLAYAQLRNFEREKGLTAMRHRIEHVQILHPDDYGKLAQLGIIASMQPIHATSDMHIADRHWGARSVGGYAVKTLLDRGTQVCFGSDAPVELPNPFLGLHAAVTRRRPDGTPSAEGWYPAQRMALEEALQGFTLGPAYAAGLETQLGRLAAGYFADLIVLNEDPFSIPAENIYQIKPSATMVGGEWVWQEN